MLFFKIVEDDSYVIANKEAYCSGEWQYRQLRVFLIQKVVRDVLVV